MATFRWYNPLTWRFFGYDDPKTGDYVEVDLEMGGKSTKSGVRITSKKAMTISMVWACVKILSESAAGLPWPVYEDTEGKRKRLSGDTAEKRRILRLVRKPHPLITWLNFIKFVVVNMALRGNAYAIIERGTEGEWIGLTPVACDQVELDTESIGSLVYWVSTDADRTPVSPENMLHFKLFSPDGVIGFSPIESQAETMGLARAAQDWSARFMRKGGFTGGYVIYDGFLTREQQAQILERFPDIRRGDVDDIAKMGILQGGPKIVPAGLSQKDSQFIESQQFQEEALAGVWGVPLYMVNRARSTSVLGSNLEQQKSGFVTFGLKPYLDAIESEINDKIFGDTGYFIEAVVEGLLRGDSAARADYYQKALGGNNGPGWLSADDVRAKENEPLLGGQYAEVLRWEKSANAEQT